MGSRRDCSPTAVHHLQFCVFPQVWEYFKSSFTHVGDGSSLPSTILTPLNHPARSEALHQLHIAKCARPFFTSFLANRFTFSSFSLDLSSKRAHIPTTALYPPPPCLVSSGALSGCQSWSVAPVRCRAGLSVVLQPPQPVPVTLEVWLLGTQLVKTLCPPLGAATYSTGVWTDIPAHFASWFFIHIAFYSHCPNDIRAGDKAKGIFADNLYIS